MPGSRRRPAPAAADRTRPPVPTGRAATADRYELYHLAVQAPDEEVAFLRQMYQDRRGRQPRHLREDFSGTALVATEWVRQGKGFSAEAYDIDPEVFDWAHRHHVGELGRTEAARLKLRLEDVRTPSLRPPDVRCAENFSYFLLMRRGEMLDYFSGVRRDLAPGGIFVIDAWGGDRATDPVSEERKLPGGVTYVWQQKSYVPVTGEMECAIHFRFRDGSALEDAFRYTWRFWTLPELRDLLFDAGFASVDAYFEDFDAKGNGTGLFSKGTGPVDASYLAYLVAAR